MLSNLKKIKQKAFKLAYNIQHSSTLIRFMKTGSKIIYRTAKTNFFIISLLKLKNKILSFGPSINFSLILNRKIR